MTKISNYLVGLLIFFIYFSFFFGFFNHEDAAGGGKIDLDHIYHNIQLFKNNNFFNIPWDQYDSTSLPLYYLIIKYLIPFNDIFIFGNIFKKKDLKYICRNYLIFILYYYYQVLFIETIYL